MRLADLRGKVVLVECKPSLRSRLSSEQFAVMLALLRLGVEVRVYRAEVLSEPLTLLSIESLRPKSYRKAVEKAAWYQTEIAASPPGSPLVPWHAFLREKGLAHQPIGKKGMALRDKTRAILRLTPPVK